MRRSLDLAVNTGVLVLIMAAMAPFLRPQIPHGQPETAIEVRVNQLETTVERMQAYDSRMTRVEDSIDQLRKTSEDASWWYRGIGIALAIAVAERILRSLGILSPTRVPGSGIGPVG